MADLLQKYSSEAQLRSSKGGAVLVRFSLTLLGVFLLVWGGLVLWERKLLDTLEAAAMREAALSQEEGSSEIRDAKATQARLSVLGQRLRAHTMPTQFFDVMELAVHPRMQLLAVSVPSPLTGETSLRGEAEGLGVLAASLQGWLSREEVKDASVPEISRREGRVSFRAELKLDPSVFVERGP